MSPYHHQLSFALKRNATSCSFSCLIMQKGNLSILKWTTCNLTPFHVSPPTSSSQLALILIFLLIARTNSTLPNFQVQNSPKKQNVLLSYVHNFHTTYVQVKSAQYEDSLIYFYYQNNFPFFFLIIIAYIFIMSYLL